MLHDIYVFKIKLVNFHWFIDVLHIGVSRHAYTINAYLKETVLSCKVEQTYQQRQRFTASFDRMRVDLLNVIRCYLVENADSPSTHKHTTIAISFSSSTWK